MPERHRKSIQALLGFPYGYHAGALAFHILLALPAIFIIVGWLGAKVPEIKTYIERAIEEMPPGEVKEFVGIVYRRSIESDTGFGIFALVFYCLSALGFAGAVQRSVQAAAPTLARQQAILTRIALVAGGFLWITVFYAVSTTLAQVFPALFGSIGGKVLTTMGTSVLFWAGYITLLKHDPLHKLLIIMAIANGFLVSIGQAFFSWYLAMVGRLLSIYGAVSSLLVLALWVYVVTTAFLVGARLLEVSSPAGEDTPSLPRT